MTPETLRGPAQVVCDKIKTLCGVDELQGANVVRIKK
jgi:hypothetical protein